MMNEDPKLKFTSKLEITEAIKALTPFVIKKESNPSGGIAKTNSNFDFALEKIIELTKLL